MADFLDHIAYGERVTTGNGMPLGLKPGTLEAVTALAPAAVGAGKAAWKAAGPIARALEQPAGVLAAGAGPVPYLKSLGGKEHIDEHGHRWIEVPAKRGRTPMVTMTGATVGAGGLAASQKEKSDD